MYCYSRDNIKCTGQGLYIYPWITAFYFTRHEYKYSFGAQLGFNAGKSTHKNMPAIYSRQTKINIIAIALESKYKAYHRLKQEYRE